LTSGQKTKDSGGNHFEITKKVTEFCPSGFTAQPASMRIPKMVAKVSGFPTAGQRKKILWERDCGIRMIAA